MVVKIFLLAPGGWHWQMSRQEEIWPLDILCVGSSASAEMRVVPCQSRGWNLPHSALAVKGRQGVFAGMSPRRPLPASGTPTPAPSEKDSFVYSEQKILIAHLTFGTRCARTKDGSRGAVSRLGIHHGGESKWVYQKRRGWQAMNHRKTLEAKELRALIQPNEGA